MLTMRPYQGDAITDIHNMWGIGARNVLYVLPTGGGKTVIFSEILRRHQGAGVAIAHRQELVGQISLSLAGAGVRHQIIGPRAVIKMILDLHRSLFGATFYDPAAPVAVAGVDTLIRRADKLKSWINQVTLWVQDEGHHALPENKWGKAISLFPHARGLGVTATPERADGKGLDGIFNHMIIGPSMRELISQAYLADYRIFAPPSDLDLTGVKIARDGDYSRPSLRDAVGKSHIVGDVIEHYKRIALGKQGVTFATDVETAATIAVKYRDAGVAAALVSANTPDGERQQLINQFRAGQLQQLVNVDLFGEGFDVPGIEVVSMARPTQSYAVYAQQFGRALRPLPGKDAGIIVDHVGNVQRHRLPDAVRHWSLKGREKGARRARDPDAIPVTTCTSCFRVYEAITLICPFCGHKSEPRARSAPEHVDGDLYELDPAALAALRGEVERIDGPVRVPEGMTGYAARGLINRWRDRQTAQGHLRDMIAQWAGYGHAAGMGDPEILRRFYFKFGVDVMTAQTLGAPDAERLAAEIFNAISA